MPIELAREPIAGEFDEHNLQPGGPRELHGREAISAAGNGLPHPCLHFQTEPLPIVVVAHVAVRGVRRFMRPCRGYAPQSRLRAWRLSSSDAAG